MTSTDIVISSNVVTETVAPTPTLPDGGLASSDYVNTFAQCGNYRDFSVSQILREIKLGAFRDVLKNLPFYNVERLRIFYESLQLQFAKLISRKI